MAAPALVALAHGSRDPRSAETITALVDEVRRCAPTSGSSPRSSSCRARRSRRSSTGWSRPATTRSSSYRCCYRGLPRQGRRPRAPSPRRPRGTRACRSGPPRSSASRPASSRCSTCGCARRCKASRVRELDALVLAAAGSSDPLANQAVARLARLWGTHHKLPVTAAFASSAPPATGEAVRAFRGRGPPPHRGRLAVPGPRLPPGPGRGAGPRGRRRRGLRAAGRPPRARPHHPGPLRRRRRRARPRLTSSR